MTWKPGQSGNPNGQPPAAKIATEALRVAAMRKDKKGATSLRKIAAKVVAKAVKGEAWAVGMVFDRLEGKVPQPVAGSLEVGPTALFIQVLKDISAGKYNPHDPKLIEHEAQEPAE